MRTILWSERARGDIRRLDRDVAMRIFAALDRFAKTGEGDLKKLKEEDGELRLRVGDYRVPFSEEPGNILHVHSVRHRREAYR